MRKYILIISFLLVACSNDDENHACSCRGEFQLMSDIGTAETFFADGVECETGEPILSHQMDMGTPAMYLGCDE